jgi:hypothetical protein
MSPRVHSGSRPSMQMWLRRIAAAAASANRQARRSAAQSGKQETLRNFKRFRRCTGSAPCFAPVKRITARFQCSTRIACCSFVG